MQWSCDRTRFPLLELPDLGLTVTLWPVLKVQYERYLAEPTGPGDAWYQNVLTINPRASYRRCDPNTREQLLMTGVFAPEARQFAQWLGEGMDLPTMEVWRQVDQYLLDRPLQASQLTALTQAHALHPAARSFANMLGKFVKPTTWGELALLRGGVLEWVRNGNRFGGLGRLRPQFKSLILNPQRDQPVMPLQEQRMNYLGFRVVGPLFVADPLDDAGLSE